jgi:SRSO17 transposase
MRLNFIRAALSLDLNNSTLAQDAVGPSTPTDLATRREEKSIQARLITL